MTPLGLHVPSCSYDNPPCCVHDSGQTSGWKWAHLRIEACPDHHPAEVSEPVLPSDYEQRLIEVRVVLSQLFFLHFPGRGDLWESRVIRKFAIPKWESGNTAAPCTFSFLLAPFSPVSSLFHCLLFVRFYISLYWNARNKGKRAYQKGRFFWTPHKMIIF